MSSDLFRDAMRGGPAVPTNPGPPAVKQRNRKKKRRGTKAKKRAKQLAGERERRNGKALRADAALEPIGKWNEPTRDEHGNIIAITGELYERGVKLMQEIRKPG